MTLESEYYALQSLSKASARGTFFADSSGGIDRGHSTGGHPMIRPGGVVELSQLKWRGSVKGGLHKGACNRCIEDNPTGTLDTFIRLTVKSGKATEEDHNPTVELLSSFTGQ